MRIFRFATLLVVFLATATAASTPRSENPSRAGPGRINGGRALLARHAALFARIEQKFGVPRQIIVAICELESDFGKGDTGKLPVIRTLATLAHDCRRSEYTAGFKMGSPMAKAPPISRRCTNGIARRSVARPSAISRTG
jgi:hypothetical protein